VCRALSCDDLTLIFSKMRAEEVAGVLCVWKVLVSDDYVLLDILAALIMLARSDVVREREYVRQ
jgi:hypothetical protein